MIEFKIRITNKIVAVSGMFENTKEFCKNYLHQGSTDFIVKITSKDIDYEREKSRREDEIEGRVPQNHSDAYLETIAVQRKIAERLFDYDTLLFHGSVIAVDGQAYLFTAKSGTGKSTHTRLWRELLGEKAVMVNDDKPFLKCENGKVIAYGSPWNGKHRLGSNIAVPLKAICILDRGEENAIERISPAAALPMLLQQSNRPMDRLKMPRYMDLIDKLSRSTEFYRLRCNMNPDAAQVAYEGMSK